MYGKAYVNACWEQVNDRLKMLSRRLHDGTDMSAPIKETTLNIRAISQTTIIRCAKQSPSIFL